MEVISYHRPRQIQVKEIERLKLENFVTDESGKRPVMISVVMPTFNKHSKEYNRTVMNIINKLGSLIDDGVIDEVVIAEGSRTEEEKPDFEYMEFLLACAIKASRTFEREVEFVRSLPEGKQRALQGRYDFSFRILNQLDPELHRIYLNHRILNEKELEVLKRGKGANLWFSVPVTYGDIICFIDSDIVSFKKHYIKGLCRPILQGWYSGGEVGDDYSSTLFTKATYIRRHKSNSGFTLGGRLSRLFGIPMFNVLAKYGIFNGLDSISYPFSGECAITRRKLNELQFSNGYDIEISVLCQLWKNHGMEKIAQYDLGIFSHIPGDEKHVDDMLREISMALFYWIRRYGFEDKIKDLKTLLDEYEKTALKMLDVYEKVADEIPRITYGEDNKEVDRERILRYRKIVEEGYELSKREKPKLLKPWSEVKKQMDSQVGYSYQSLKSVLQNRVNKFTSNTILSYIRIYVDMSSEIIAKFT
ncbi:MAG TPA: hypothetical protein ENG12_04700 [Candidatus Altiarchaeales archaeon]|nr:hypothetical protein [Candidatus Altiarchaeales archaeon]